MKRRELKDAVVVLTGASSGIGRAAAFRFAARRARLVLAARDPEALEEVAVECRDTFGVDALSVVTDIRDEVSVDALAQIAVERFGRIDVWVNDAAVYMLGTIEDCPTQAVKDLFETNIMGTLHGTRAAMAQFRKQGRGVLINMGSVAGRSPTRRPARTARASTPSMRSPRRCGRRSAARTFTRASPFRRPSTRRSSSMLRTTRAARSSRCGRSTRRSASRAPS